MVHKLKLHELCGVKLCMYCDCERLPLDLNVKYKTWLWNRWFITIYSTWTNIEKKNSVIKRYIDRLIGYLLCRESFCIHKFCLRSFVWLKCVYAYTNWKWFTYRLFCVLCTDKISSQSNLELCVWAREFYRCCSPSFSGKSNRNVRNETAVNW